MKILITTGIYWPNFGGPATYSKLLKDKLPQKGIDIEVLSFDEVRHLPKLIRHLVYFLKIVKKIKNKDIIFAQDPVSVGLPSAIAAKIFKKKIILRFVGDYAWEQSCQRFGVDDLIEEFQNKKYSFRIEILRKIQVFVANQTYKIITPSIYFKNLISKWVKDPDKIYPIYNGIDLDIKIFDKQILRQEKQFSSNDFILVTAGRLVPWKGIELLIEIINELKVKIENIKLVIIGDGPDKESLNKKIIELQLKDRVFLTGRLDQEDLLAYYQLADVFILNTSFESFSFQVVEAMASGIPVITTNVCNLPEIINNNQEGVLVDFNNKEQIIKAIDDIKNNSELRNNLILNARNKAKKFSIDNTINNLINLLKK